MSATRTVRNLTESTVGQQSSRVRLVPLDLPGEGPLTFPRNPEAWTIKYNPVWRPRRGVGIEVDTWDWIRNDSAIIEMRQVFQVEDQVIFTPPRTYTVDRQARLALERFLQTLESWATRKSTVTGQPTKMLLSMGVHGRNVHMEPPSIERLRVDTDGNAVIAAVQLTFVEDV